MKDNEIKKAVEDLMADMSLEEKIGQLLYLNGAREYELDYIEKYYAGTIANLQGAEVSNGLQRRVMAASPHNIPALLMSDVIQGFRTIFPIPLAEACSFDPELAEFDSECIMREAVASGVSWTCAPMVDIARDPRWGRVSEGAGEDPYLGSLMAAARVRGIAKAKRIASTAKHFVAYGNCEGGRDYDAALVNEAELRNVYLRPFKAAVEAGADSVMAAFNDTLGIPMHANKYLIEDVLRGEFGFKGAIVSDYNAIDELINHGVAADRDEACSKAFAAGVDLDTGSLNYQENLIKKVKSGEISEADIDKYCARILTIKYKLGLFDNPFYSPEEEAATVLCDELKKAARTAAARSTVLLKNNNKFFPLKKKEKILVIGPLADDRDAPLGWWRLLGEEKDVTSLLTAMKEKSKNVAYVKGGNTLDGGRIAKKQLAEAAAECDKIVAVVGEPAYISGEAHSIGDISLPGTQKKLMEYVASLGKPLAMVLITGRPLVISNEDALCDAVVCAWQYGVAGEGVADILFGDELPDAKLCVTFPYHVGQIPIYYGRVTTGRPYKGEVVEMTKKVSSYATDYTCHYTDMPNDPLYPFGHGLTYTQFEISEPTTGKKKYRIGEKVNVSFTVKNKGGKPGTATLQLYIHDVSAEISRPVKELKAIKKQYLEPGESVKITMTLTPDSFEYYHFDNSLKADPGKFIIWAAEDSASGCSTEIELI
ncbi:MAG: glycoside hydrolase family 3 C-terminal domain-containing protein [Clostridia bacterium]|nr:glycoside hydrolase family 3 C-terminal domain-containing protein [Clostridia bacterium]